MARIGHGETGVSPLSAVAAGRSPTQACDAGPQLGSRERRPGGRLCSISGFRVELPCAVLAAATFRAGLARRSAGARDGSVRFPVDRECVTVS